MAFTIRELESLSGIKAHTIRIWEQRYNFLKPSRTQTNIRVYSNEELKTLLTVSLLNKYGYKISRIDQMQPAQRAEALLQLSGKHGHDERIVNELIGYLVEMKNQAFEEVLKTYTTQHCIDKTITGLLLLFLEKIGVLWKANRILPVQEHIVANIIRQKIVSAIEQLPSVHTDGPSFLLFLPEDEYHEMGLLYVYYLLRKKNIPVLYLGANVPIKDVHYVIQVKHPDYLYLHLTSSIREQQLANFMQTFTKAKKDIKVIISGTPIHVVQEKFPKSLIPLQALSDVVKYIDQLVFV